MTLEQNKLSEYDRIDQAIDQQERLNTQQFDSLTQQIKAKLQENSSPEDIKVLTALQGEILLLKDQFGYKRDLYGLTKEILTNTDQTDDIQWSNLLDRNNNNVIDVADATLPRTHTEFTQAFDRLKGEITRQKNSVITMTPSGSQNVFTIVEDANQKTRTVTVQDKAVGILADMGADSRTTIQATLQGSFTGTLIGKALDIKAGPGARGPINAFIHAQGHGGGIGATADFTLPSNQANAVSVASRGGSMDVGGGQIALLASGQNGTYTITHASKVFLNKDDQITQSTTPNNNGFNTYRDTRGNTYQIASDITVDMGQSRNNPNSVFNDTRAFANTGTGVSINQPPHDVAIFQNGTEVLRADQILKIPDISVDVTAPVVTPPPAPVVQYPEYLTEAERIKKDLQDEISAQLKYHKPGRNGTVTVSDTQYPEAGISKYQVVIDKYGKDIRGTGRGGVITDGDISKFVQEYIASLNTPTPADDSDCDDCHPDDTPGDPDKPDDPDKPVVDPEIGGQTVRLGNDYHNKQTPDMPESNLAIKKSIFRKAEVGYLLKAARKYLPEEDVKEAKDAITDLKAVNRESAHRVMIEEINKGNTAATIDRPYMIECNRYVPRGKFGRREARKLKALGSLLDSGDTEVTRLLGEAARVYATTDEKGNRNKQGAKETLGVYQLTHETDTVTDMEVADTLSTRFADDNYDGKSVVGPGTVLPGGPEQLDYDDVHISDRRKNRLLRKGKKDKLDKIMDRKLARRQKRVDNKFQKKAEKYVAKNRPDQGILGGRQIKEGYQHALHILRMEAIAKGEDPDTYASAKIAQNIADMIAPHVSQSTEVQTALDKIHNESDLLGFARDFPAVIPQIRMHFRTTSPREFEYMMIGGTDMAVKKTIDRTQEIKNRLQANTDAQLTGYEQAMESDPQFSNALDAQMQACISKINISQYDPAIQGALQDSLTDIRRSPSVDKPMRTQFLLSLQQDLRDNRPAQAQAFQNMKVVEQNLYDFQTKYSDYISRVNIQDRSVVFKGRPPKEISDQYSNIRSEYEKNAAILNDGSFDLGATRIGAGVSHSFLLAQWNKRVANLNLGAGASIQANGKNAQVGFFFGPSLARSMGRKDQNNIHMGIGVGVGRLAGHKGPIVGTYAGIGTNVQVNLKAIESSLSQKSAHYIDIDLGAGINLAEGKLHLTPDLYVGMHQEKIKGLEQQKVAMFETLVKKPGGIFDVLYTEIMAHEKDDCPLTIPAITKAIKKLYPDNAGTFDLSQSAETLYHALLPFDDFLRDPKIPQDQKQALFEYFAEVITNHVTANRMEQMNKLYFRGAQVPVIATTLGILALIGGSAATGGLAGVLGISGGAILGTTAVQTLLTSIGLIKQPVYRATASGIQAAETNRRYGLGAEAIEVGPETLQARVDELNRQYSSGARAEDQAFAIYTGKNGVSGIKINTKMIDPADRTPNLAKINLHVPSKLLTSIRHDNGWLIVPDNMTTTHTLDNHQQYYDIIIGQASMQDTKQIGIGDVSKFDNPAYGPEKLQTTETISKRDDINTLVNSLGDFKDKFDYNFDSSKGELTIKGLKNSHAGNTYPGAQFPLVVKQGQSLTLTLDDGHPGKIASMSAQVSPNNTGTIDINYKHTTYTKKTTAYGAQGSGGPDYSTGTSGGYADVSPTTTNATNTYNQQEKDRIMVSDFAKTGLLTEVGTNALNGVYDTKIKGAKSVKGFSTSYKQFRDAMREENYSSALTHASKLIGVSVTAQADLFAIQNACNYIHQTENIKDQPGLSRIVTQRTDKLKTRIMQEQSGKEDVNKFGTQALWGELVSLRDSARNHNPTDIDKTGYTDALAFVFGYEQQDTANKEVNEKFVLGTEVISGTAQTLDLTTHSNTIHYFIKNLLDKPDLFNIILEKLAGPTSGISTQSFDNQAKKKLLETLLTADEHDTVDIGGKQFGLRGTFFFGLNPKCFNETIGIKDLKLYELQKGKPDPYKPTPGPLPIPPAPIPSETYEAHTVPYQGSLKKTTESRTVTCPPQFAYNTMAVDSSASAREGAILGVKAGVNIYEAPLPSYTSPTVTGTDGTEATADQMDAQMYDDMISDDLKTVTYNDKQYDIYTMSDDGGKTFYNEIRNSDNQIVGYTQDGVFSTTVEGLTNGSPSSLQVDTNGNLVPVNQIGSTGLSIPGRTGWVGNGTGNGPQTGELHEIPVAQPGLYQTAIGQDLATLHMMTIQGAQPYAHARNLAEVQTITQNLLTDPKLTHREKRILKKCSKNVQKISEKYGNLALNTGSTAPTYNQQTNTTTNKPIQQPTNQYKQTNTTTNKPTQYNQPNTTNPIQQTQYNNPIQQPNTTTQYNPLSPTNSPAQDYSDQAGEDTDDYGDDDE